MSKLVTIFGGSGFIGRYIARRLASRGWRVRVACRHPNEAQFVRTYGVVGQVEPVFCNIRDDASVRSVAHRAGAVVNCVGTFDAKGKNNFEAIQIDGAGRIARIATEEGATRLVHISAIGAAPDSESAYARSKAAGEDAVSRAFPGVVILRPSVVFGPEDQFFNRFAGMTRFSPILPLVGAETRFQPVYVDDVANAAAMGAEAVAAGIYELGGPDVATFREWMHEMLEVIQRRRLVIGLPFWAGGLIGRSCDVASAMTGGLFRGPITRDQVKALRHDNVVSEDAMGFADLRISPTAAEVILPEYLWRFRPSGQYAEIKDSLKRLRRV